jgi:hypothetical protein
LTKLFPPLVEADAAEGVGAKGAGEAEGFGTLQETLGIPLGAADAGEILRPHREDIHGPKDLFVVAHDKGVGQFLRAFRLCPVGACNEFLDHGADGSGRLGCRHSFPGFLLLFSHGLSLLRDRSPQSTRRTQRCCEIKAVNPCFFYR